MASLTVQKLLILLIPTFQMLVLTPVGHVQKLLSYDFKLSIFPNFPLLDSRYPVIGWGFAVGERQEFSFILLHSAMHLKQYHILKTVFFFSHVFLLLLSQKSDCFKVKYLSGSPVLSIDKLVSFTPVQCVFITVAG